jgi:hypothetical protein
MEILKDLTQRGTVVGVDLVEVAPAYDLSGITTFLAAQVLLNFLATSPPSAAFHKTRADASHGVFPAQYRVRESAPIGPWIRSLFSRG